MTEEYIYSTVTDGNPTNLKYLYQVIAGFSGNIEIIVRKKRSTRSNQQNRYWWACMTILSKELGYTKNEIHEICKFKFLKREKINEITGEVMPYIKESHLLTKSEFADMTTEMIQWSAEMGIVIPAPNEQTTIEVNEQTDLPN